MYDELPFFGSLVSRSIYSLYTQTQIHSQNDTTFIFFSHLIDIFRNVLFTKCQNVAKHNSILSVTQILYGGVVSWWHCHLTVFIIIALNSTKKNGHSNAKISYIKCRNALWYINDYKSLRAKNIVTVLYVHW